ncbi:hypothetical protein DFH06DRAFT_1317551 [Mycena polygramma]|nr:hypothetical protein DFH06DRAFT_1317551 [Mycena polygramma]
MSSATETVLSTPELLEQPDPTSTGDGMNTLLVELFPPFLAPARTTDPRSWPNTAALMAMPWATAPDAFRRPEVPPHVVGPSIRASTLNAIEHRAHPIRRADHASRPCEFERQSAIVRAADDSVFSFSYPHRTHCDDRNPSSAQIDSLLPVPPILSTLRTATPLPLCARVKLIQVPRKNDAVSTGRQISE